jgi:hypothetical protein
LGLVDKCFSKIGLQKAGRGFDVEPVLSCKRIDDLLLSSFLWLTLTKPWQITMSSWKELF